MPASAQGKDVGWILLAFAIFNTNGMRGAPFLPVGKPMGRTA